MSANLWGWSSRLAHSLDRCAPGALMDWQIWGRWWMRGRGRLYLFYRRGLWYVTDGNAADAAPTVNEAVIAWAMRAADREIAANRDQAAQR